MLQTDRKTDQNRQTVRDREHTQQDRRREPRSAAALALEAILAGGSWEQLPADDVLQLSHTMGNAALLDLYALRSLSPEAAAIPLPQSTIETAPLSTLGGEPAQAETPGFASMSSLGGTAPLAL